MQKLTTADLAAESVEMLPSRETLFLDWNAALISASNTSVALNADTWFSRASSAALQMISVNQH
ncbi:hypothetical protein RBS60_02680 [Sinomonas sp. ASV486]|uniref:hypothetical protein n=1 Tax=Sinomonas sp. ASV486 TaxID=3051170 RepID=UPI0027DDFE61|nr:hypothetical protein [Sinomonas sp. ASV486]MDQ4489102.1 hypothetical protein [Sinomonas sp. ASV486]